MGSGFCADTSRGSDADFVGSRVDARGDASGDEFDRCRHEFSVPDHYGESFAAGVADGAAGFDWGSQFVSEPECAADNDDI